MILRLNVHTYSLVANIETILFSLLLAAELSPSILHGLLCQKLVFVYNFRHLEKVAEMKFIVLKVNVCCRTTKIDKN